MEVVGYETINPQFDKAKVAKLASTRKGTDELLAMVNLSKPKHKAYTSSRVHTRRDGTRIGLLLGFDTPEEAKAFCTGKAHDLRELKGVSVGFFRFPAAAHAFTQQDAEARASQLLASLAPPPPPPATSTTTAGDKTTTGQEQPSDGAGRAQQSGEDGFIVVTSRKRKTSPTPEVRHPAAGQTANTPSASGPSTGMSPGATPMDVVLPHAGDPGKQKAGSSSGVPSFQSLSSLASPNLPDTGARGVAETKGGRTEPHPSNP